MHSCSYNSIVTTHFFRDEGKYTVRAVALDSHTVMTQEIPVVIAAIECTLPVVSINDRVQYLGGVLPNVWRSFKVRAETTASYQCNKTVPVK